MERAFRKPRHLEKMSARQFVRILLPEGKRRRDR